MEIIIAEHAGFCGGVKRAVLLAESTLKEEKQAYGLGPLVHNRHVVEKLGEMGLKDALKEEPASDAVIISRSHCRCAGL
jgi:4-hydroxy-3-methylbut-2-enyl diphosphate reductase IspH